MADRIVFKYEDKTYTYGNLKVREIESLEDLLGCRYVEFGPFTHMRHKLAIMAVFLGRDFSEDKVAAILEDLDLEAVQDMWDVVDDDLPTAYEDGLPLAGDGASTATN